MTSFITSARRSAVVPRGGAFAHLALHDLAAPVITAALASAGLAPEQVDELVLSNAMGGGGNPARVAALAAGLPERVAGLSIDRQCAGGLDALLVAHQMVASGMADVVVAGGVESYSRRPERRRTFVDGRAPEPYDQPAFTPWPDRDPDMAVAADLLGQALGINRAAQDSWAMASHAKALAALPGPDEIVGLAGVEKDPFARALGAQVCARATPIAGDVTSANTAVAADGAAFCVVVSQRMLAKQAGLRILGGLTCGAAPDRPGLAPVAAIDGVLGRLGMTADDMDVAEVMEAYAVQAIACVEQAQLDPARVNLGGGALARGHPIGASGAVNAVRLFHELRARGGTGLAAIAAAGGIGTALVLAAG